MSSLKFTSRNISLLYSLKFLSGLIFFLPILALYFEESLFNITNIAIIFSVQAIAQTLFELPTGAIADLVGRKKTMVLVQVASILALIFLIIGGNLWMFILFAIVDAFARSLRSGTDTSLLYDTLKDEKKEQHFKQVSGKAAAIAHTGIAIGSVIGGYLAAISLSLSVQLTLIPVLVALIVSFFLEEPKFEKDDHAVTTHLKESTKFVLSNKQILIIISGLVIISAAFDTIVSLNPLWYRFKGIPIEMFGWISAAIFGLAALGYYYSHAFATRFGDKRAILLTVIFPPVTLFVATLLDSYMAVLASILSPLFYGLRTPIVDHMIHAEVTSSKRATVYSVGELSKKLATAIFAPFAGYLADLYTINTAFQISAGILLIVPVLYFFLKE